MSSWKGLKTVAKGFVPGWAVYNKRHNGADYTVTGAASYYPEASEICRGLLAAVPALAGEPLVSVIYYFIVSLMNVPQEQKLERIKEYVGKYPEVDKLFPWLKNYL